MGGREEGARASRVICCPGSGTERQRIDHHHQVVRPSEEGGVLCAASLGRIKVSGAAGSSARSAVPATVTTIHPLGKRQQEEKAAHKKKEAQSDRKF